VSTVAALVVPGLGLALTEWPARALGTAIAEGLAPALGTAVAEGLAPALGVGWAAVVAVTLTVHARRRGARRPAGPTDRRAATAPGPPAAAHGEPSSAEGTTTTPAGPVVARLGAAVGRLGAAVRRFTASALPAGANANGEARSRPASPLGARGRCVAGSSAPLAQGESTVDADRRAGWATLASLGLLFVAPPLAAAPLAWVVGTPLLVARRRQARHEARLHDQLPDVVDLLALTAGAGLPVGPSLLAIGDRPGGPLGAAVARAAAHLRHGGTTAEALDRLAAVGPPARPLVDALVQHDRYGTPLLPALDRVAIEARARRRRRSEEAARRLPVTLLFPLVLTTFPAFVLLTVVPLLAGSLGSLSLTPP
jgi:tight adherence protein C